MTSPASAAVRILNTNAIEPATTQLLEDCARVLRSCQVTANQTAQPGAADKLEDEVTDIIARLDVCLRVRGEP